MNHVTARLVQKYLNFLHKLNRIKAAEDMLERFNSDPKFMKRIVTNDKTLVYEFLLRTSQQAYGTLQLNFKRKNHAKDGQKLCCLFCLIIMNCLTDRIVVVRSNSK